MSGEFDKSEHLSDPRRALKRERRVRRIRCRNKPVTLCVERTSELMIGLRDDDDVFVKPEIFDYFGRIFHVRIGIDSLVFAYYSFGVDALFDQFVADALRFRDVFAFRAAARRDADRLRMRGKIIVSRVYPCRKRKRRDVSFDLRSENHDRAFCSRRRIELSRKKKTEQRQGGRQPDEEKCPYGSHHGFCRIRKYLVSEQFQLGNEEKIKPDKKNYRVRKSENAVYTCLNESEVRHRGARDAEKASAREFHPVLFGSSVFFYAVEYQRRREKNKRDKHGQYDCYEHSFLLSASVYSDYNTPRRRLSIVLNGFYN